MLNSEVGIWRIFYAAKFCFFGLIGYEKVGTKPKQIFNNQANTVLLRTKIAIQKCIKDEKGLDTFLCDKFLLSPQPKVNKIW